MPWCVCFLSLQSSGFLWQLCCYQVKLSKLTCTILKIFYLRTAASVEMKRFWHALTSQCSNRRKKNFLTRQFHTSESAHPVSVPVYLSGVSWLLSLFWLHIARMTISHSWKGQITARQGVERHSGNLQIPVNAGCDEESWQFGESTRYFWIW